ncbi:MAG: SH3 domain-containing protein [Thermomicrobiales bacterium]
MTNIGDQIVVEAQKHLGKPYVWATRGPDTFDCSGFVHYCYLIVTGQWITPASSQQVYLGDYVSFENLRPGDIVCFDVDGDGSCGHTGIYVGNNQHINALREDVGVTTSPVVSGTYWGQAGGAVFLGGRRLYPYADNPSPGGSNPPTPPAQNRGTEYPTQPGTVLTPTLRDTGSRTDLGAVKTLKAITWKATLDVADSAILVETSLDGSTWEAVGTFAKPTSTERRGIAVDLRARYLRSTVVHAAGAVRSGFTIELTAIAADTTPPPVDPTTYTHRVSAALNLRTGAGTSNAIIVTLPVGTRLKLLGGPISANGYQWYQVQAEGYGTGWAINAFDVIVTETPSTPPPTTTPPPASWTHIVDNGPLNLRSGAGTSYGVIGSLANGVKLRLLTGPTSANGYTWYQVTTDTGLTGWCVQGFSPL